jgi:hypothetical protein
VIRDNEAAGDSNMLVQSSSGPLQSLVHHHRIVPSLLRSISLCLIFSLTVYVLYDAVTHTHARSKQIASYNRDITAAVRPVFCDYGGHVKETTWEEVLHKPSLYVICFTFHFF